MRRIRPLTPEDGHRHAELLTTSWGSTRMATHGRLVDVTALPRFVAEDDGEWLGYVNYETLDTEIEIVAVADERESIKPEIALTGEHDFPIRDELELQLPAPAWPEFVDRYGWPTS
jgi:hypothetical protein